MSLLVSRVLAAGSGDYRWDRRVVLGSSLRFSAPTNRFCRVGFVEFYPSANSPLVSAMQKPIVSVQASSKSAANSPVKPSAPEGPARMVLAVPDEPARGHWGDSNRIAPGKGPVLRDELTAVVAKQQYPRERLQRILSPYKPLWLSERISRSSRLLNTCSTKSIIFCLSFWSIPVIGR
jgi:hypothetical protein